VGVIGERVIVLKEATSGHPSDADSHSDDIVFCCPSAPDEAVETLRETLVDYFQLGTPLAALYTQWRLADARTGAVLDALPGLRILRQEPTECLFSFICSSNNNIGRITGILERLRAAYGEPIPIIDARPFGGGESSELQFHAFPTVERFAAVPEEELRALGLGYRAPYIRKTAALLLERGGADWLLAQRARDRHEVQASLVELSGVGRKVADCVALFSLDQTATIPVDVHVWQIACRDYDPTLQEAKSLTPPVYSRVGDLFRERFGAHAGWAHSALFAAELPLFKALLPEEVQQEMEVFRLAERVKSAEKKTAKLKRDADREAEDGSPRAAAAPRKTPASAPPAGGSAAKGRARASPAAATSIEVPLTAPAKRAAGVMHLTPSAQQSDSETPARRRRRKILLEPESEEQSDGES
jgi:N-glycosylase/DNA lyase